MESACFLDTSHTSHRGPSLSEKAKCLSSSVQNLRGLARVTPSLQRSERGYPSAKGSKALGVGVEFSAEGSGALFSELDLRGEGSRALVSEVDPSIEGSRTPVRVCDPEIMCSQGCSYYCPGK